MSKSVKGFEQLVIHFIFSRYPIARKFLNALKDKSCIAKQYRNLKRKETNTCFEIPLLLQIFGNYFYLLGYMICTKSNIIHMKFIFTCC